ncbi:lysoplasmalogenase [Desulfobacterales bacterium HSG16]|nr:lysoplasmalogenase [Desulfobacterales bacterium HSG16]
MLEMILTIMAIISAGLHIRAEYKGPQRNIYIFKPLTMVFILAIAILGHNVSPFYKYMIIIGLIFSLAGDIFLMLPSDRFVAGLVAFLIAHLFYIAAFTSEIDVISWWPLIPLMIYGIVVYSILAPFLGKLKLPVTAYVAVIMIMTWTAWEPWSRMEGKGALLASLGAVLFVISDTILALNRFKGAFKPARFFNLTTYFSAQWLIAFSIGGFCR